MNSVKLCSMVIYIFIFKMGKIILESFKKVGGFMQKVSKTKLEFDWYDGKYYYYAGSEMLGKEFEARVFSTANIEINSNLKYAFEVYNEKGQMFFKSESIYDHLKDAQLEAEIILNDAIDTFMHKLGMSR